ncbi:MAG: valine--tRNA ligase [Chitinivibrionales bacterium]|nr:valine--tRNA ligase [Chitinivibrionales bacterium]MBD3394566.1 valine--tRNA ligase [Chitinivibrionales bacterium]
MEPMEKQYNPTAVEDRIYERWMAERRFAADPGSRKEPYSIVIPPPNVTGILHMGHALNNTVQDILIRYKRMCGYEALWMPGTDHAGIATQNVVERKLAAGGKSRHDFSREDFVNEVWKWKDEYHERITTQLKKLGSSCDWARERFTMDEGLSRAVRAVFVKLYNDGLVYRGKYIINWCPRCRTALSDEEAEHRDMQGTLYTFVYPYADGSGSLKVATTRPETMLGDTAVAVNPKDERYRDVVGRTVMLPLANREIPVITDDFVDREFGTGAVKVTPAHDPNDFQMGLRHNMEPIMVMDETAHMCGPIPEKYAGKDRFECRKLVVEDMRAAGLCTEIKEHAHAVGHCYRCHTMVEPYYSDQWFVKMKPLAEPALKAALDNDITFYPARWRKTYITWMENIRDWCISRQIWWGHRIPVWYCDSCGEVIVAEETPAACTCGSANLRQDEDVLDTWFSSWLWPFSTMGWPDKTAVLDRFYPTNALVTAPEILFFWVAKMLMAGRYCTGRLPFTDIVLHGTVRDKSGKKMSKSLGNSIDPLEVIATHGADALRFSLMMITAQGADVFLGKDTFDIGRNFANKLWNASRFLLGNITEKTHFRSLPPAERRAAVDKWILSRLAQTLEGVRSSLDSYRFNEMCRQLYDFTWHDFCDWYIEAKKADLYQSDDQVRAADALNLCGFVLGAILKVLHPVMPFVTEEIWGHLRAKVDYAGLIDNESIMAGSFPEPADDLVDRGIEEQFALLREVIVALRTIRAENNVPPDKKGTALIIPRSDREASWLTSQVPLINLFGKLSETVVDGSARKPSFAGQTVVMGNQVFLELEGLIDKDVEIERLNKEIDKARKLAENTKKRLENPGFRDKAPGNVVAKEEEKYQGILQNLEKLERNLKAFAEA